jgi:hypothetical protein
MKKSQKKQGGNGVSNMDGPAVAPGRKAAEGGDQQMGPKIERRSNNAPAGQVKFDLSRKTGKHIRLIVRIPREETDERKDKSRK